MASTRNRQRCSELLDTGNAVNGDQLNNAGAQEDKWNQLLFTLQEGSDATTALGTRTLFAGDGNVSPPEPEHRCRPASHGCSLACTLAGVTQLEP